jgi:hypothetical protein
LARDLSILDAFDLAELIAGPTMRLDIVRALFHAYGLQEWVDITHIQASLALAKGEVVSEDELRGELDILHGEGVVEFDSRNRRWKLCREAVWPIGEAHTNLPRVACLIRLGRPKAA